MYILVHTQTVRASGRGCISRARSHTCTYSSSKQNTYERRSCCHIIARGGRSRPQQAAAPQRATEMRICIHLAFSEDRTPRTRFPNGARALAREGDEEKKGAKAILSISLKEETRDTHLIHAERVHRVSGIHNSPCCSRLPSRQKQSRQIQRIVNGTRPHFPTRFIRLVQLFFSHWRHWPTGVPLRRYARGSWWKRARLATVATVTTRLNLFAQLSTMLVMRPSLVRVVVTAVSSA